MDGSSAVSDSSHDTNECECANMGFPKHPGDGWNCGMLIYVK